MQTIDHETRFHVRPIGPANVLRLVSAARSGAEADEIEELARLDLLVDDAGCHFGVPFAETFGRRDGAARTAEPACTPGHVARAVWSPDRPDALVAFDMAEARRSFLPSLCGDVPWIGALRVTRHAWPEFKGNALSEILAHRGMSDESGAIREANPERPAAQEVLRMAYLVRDMLSCMDVRCTVPFHPDPADRLRPLLGEFAADFALQGLINLSAVPAVSLRLPPDPWDVDDWMALPMDDLVCYARADGEHWGPSARVELSRRLGATTRATQQTRPRVLLRRAASAQARA